MTNKRWQVSERYSLGDTSRYILGHCKTTGLAVLYALLPPPPSFGGGDWVFSSSECPLPKKTPSSPLHPKKTHFRRYPAIEVCAKSTLAKSKLSCLRLSSSVSLVLLKLGLGQLYAQDLSLSRNGIPNKVERPVLCYTMVQLKTRVHAFSKYRKLIKCRQERRCSARALALETQLVFLEVQAWDRHSLLSARKQYVPPHPTHRKKGN